jgi:hypothetical protein
VKIELIEISPRDEFGMVFVTLSISAKREKTWDGGKLEVFVPASDSISEIRRIALESVRKLAEEILGFPANELPEDDKFSVDDFPEVTFDIPAADLKE